jgi:phage terminase small subunit
METEKKSEEVQLTENAIGVFRKNLSMWGTEFTEEGIQSAARAIISINNPLKTYIWAKALNKTLEIVLDAKNKPYRQRVKEDFLRKTEGAMDKTHFYGAEVTTTKVSIDFGEYTYSDECEQIRKDIEVMKSELEMKEKALKLRMTHEINSDIAVKITPESILGIAVQEATDKIVEESFNIKVSFK